MTCCFLHRIETASISCRDSNREKLKCRYVKYLNGFSSFTSLFSKLHLFCNCAKRRKNDIKSGMTLSKHRSQTIRIHVSFVVASHWPKFPPFCADSLAHFTLRLIAFYSLKKRGTFHTLKLISREKNASRVTFTLPAFSIEFLVLENVHIPCLDRCELKRSEHIYMNTEQG